MSQAYKDSLLIAKKALEALKKKQALPSSK